jgi:hypothetical protein
MALGESALFGCPADQALPLDEVYESIDAHIGRELPSQQSRRYNWSSVSSPTTTCVS